MKLVDLTLGTDNQARALLNLLSNVDIDNNKMFFRTAAWYNGRERGFVICVSQLIKNEQLNIAFAEVRNSDQIFVCDWITKSTLNPPTIQDCTGEAYRNRKHFGYGQISEAANYIEQVVTEYCNSNKKE